VTFRELAQRMGVRTEDLRALLRRTPGVPDELTLRKGGDGAAKFARRDVPPALEELLLGMMRKGDVKGSARVRLRQLAGKDLAGPIAPLFPATTAEEPATNGPGEEAADEAGDEAADAPGDEAPPPR
jgi:hypothetical protein